jgi:hypothetical protein
MSKHKVKRYDGEDGSMVEDDAMEMANKGENLDTEAGPKAMPMPRRPVSRTPAPAPAAAAPSKTVSGPGRKPTPPKAKYETPYDRMNRKNAEQSAAKDTYGASTRAETARLAKKSSGAMNPNTLLPKRMAKGGSTGSASSRADGCATKGKTKGTMVMCGGGMARGRK